VSINGAYKAVFRAALRLRFASLRMTNGGFALLRMTNGVFRLIKDY